MGKRILVFGWYGHQNVGDELMADGLRAILGRQHELKFVDCFREPDLESCDLVLIGGGSFLSHPITSEGEGTAMALARKPIVYAGVGAETGVHEHHARLLSRARAVFVRSRPSKAFLEARSDVTLTPDLSLALAVGASRCQRDRDSRSLLFLPNAEVVSDHASPNWKRAAWDYFKSEVAQALDELIEAGWKVTMLPLCADPQHCDEHAAAELANHCVRRELIRVEPGSWFGAGAFSTVREPFDLATVVVTQRFHGGVLSQATGAPCVVLHHHDKLARLPSSSFELVPYYGVRKDLVLGAVKRSSPPGDVVDPAAFAPIREAVEKALG